MLKATKANSTLRLQMEELMISAMTGPIIGGAIAAVIDLLGALGLEIWREHRRENTLIPSY